MADFNKVYTVFFRRDSSFRCTAMFSFSLLGGATIFEKLWSKIAKSKNLKKIPPPKFRAQNVPGAAK